MRPKPHALGQAQAGGARLPAPRVRSLQARQAGKGRRRYKRATLLEPGNAPARYNLGLVGLDLRLKAEALKQQRRLTALDERLARELCREIYKDKILDVRGGPR